MKKALIAAACLAAVGTANAADSSFVTFAIKQAHTAGFKSCDAGIREIFKDASGADMRIVTDKFANRPDQIQFTTAWGNTGDVVQQQMSLRTVGGKCLIHEWSQVTSTQDCGTWLQANNNWKVVATTLDVLFTKNKGGVDALLRPFGNSCLITYSRTAEF